MAYYLSAYAIAVAHGFRGSEAQWLASLKGLPGKSAYEVAVECGFVGTKEEWLETLKGEADLPVAQASAAAGTDHYAAYGENLPDVHKADEEQQLPAVGVGKQIVFVPQRANLTAAPKLMLNSGEQIELRLRADSGSTDTITVPIGTLKAGMPYCMTFGGTYWLVDSVIGGIGGSADRVTLPTPVTIDNVQYDTVQAALTAAAAALAEKIDEDDVQELDVIQEAEAVANANNDNAVITPKAVMKLIELYGGDAENIEVYDLDTVSTTALYALSDNPKTAVFLSYNVANYTPDPEAETVEYPYENKLLLLPMTGCKLSPLGNYLKATFEQDADLATYSDDPTPAAITVRKTVCVTVETGVTAGAPDVKTVEIEDARPTVPISTAYSVAGAPAFSQSVANTKGQFVTRNNGNDLYICTENTDTGTWSSRSAKYKYISLSFSERAYDATREFNTGDMCYYSASSRDQHMYVCTADGTTGVLPTDATKWQDLGPVFVVMREVDFRRVERETQPIFEFDFTFAHVKSAVTESGSAGSGSSYILSCYTSRYGLAAFAAIYSTSTGALTSIIYGAEPYATE